MEDLIPLNQLCIFLAQSGVGKSLLVESLAVHTVHGMPFCGWDICSGDALIIDQDTPEQVLYKRLIQFSKGLDTIKKHNLYVESMKGYLLSNKSLLGAIKQYPSVKLVVIDSLHSVCGTLNPNYTTDMNILARLKSECLTKDKTIIINHHISEKANVSVDSLMVSNPHLMAMGNSTIIQQADSYFIIGALAENGRTEKVYIRPVAKRAKINTHPLVLQIVNPQFGGERFEFLSTYEPDLTDEELDTLTYFREQPSDRTVKETYDGMGHQHGEKAIREALANLNKKGLLLLSKHKANLFKYRLP